MAKKYKIGDEDEEIKNEQAGDGENNKKVKLGGDDNEPKKKKLQMWKYLVKEKTPKITKN